MNVRAVKLITRLLVRGALVLIHNGTRVLLFKHLVEELFLKVLRVDKFAFRRLFAIECLQSLGVLSPLIFDGAKMTDE